MGDAAVCCSDNNEKYDNKITLWFCLYFYQRFRSHINNE